MSFRLALSNPTLPEITDGYEIQLHHILGHDHLIKREHQVILLSTNTEVVGQYLREIAPHVSKKYLIHFERVGEIGQSTVKIGYFEEAEQR